MQELPSKENLCWHLVHLSVAEQIEQPSEQGKHFLETSSKRYPSMHEEHAFAFIANVQVLQPVKQA